MSIQIILPWPPTANTYWRRNGSRYFISQKGMRYRSLATESCVPYRGHFAKEDNLRVSIKAYPPDKRRRDLDNLFKSVLDALQYAGVYVDDFQISDLSIKRMPVHEGFIIIDLERID